MNAIFTDKDHAHLQHQAWKIDMSGVERQQQDALIQHKLDSVLLPRRRLQRSKHLILPRKLILQVLHWC
jgi:hypothetical protein